ncbi:43kDa postsynaptic protein [Trema orientale]|uniref:43kDa postsynaptic protein n=1 Tax=Trema orientale TaxID=63057 RepID=A0A2P5DVR6_TREOI|nr:43kDa postsynaptic protein [Trema orientale]
MGAACCVAVKENTITNGSNSEILHRNIRCSPTWSFRWDHRGRVAGEETSMGWLSDGVSRNDGSETKFESAYVSEEGSPLEHFRRRTSQKSSLSEGAAGHLRTPASDQSIKRNASMDASLEQPKEFTESPTVSYPSPAKLSVSLPSTSSFTASPLSSQGQVPPANSTALRWPRHSPGHQLSRQESDTRIPGFKSPNSYSVSEERTALPSWSNESTRGSRGGSSDGWSMHAFSELMANSSREMWSFESESFGVNREKMTRASSQILASPSVDLQTCGVCSKLLTERSLWSSQKIIACNELSVVAVLICGHVYHAECLENMTPEINKYDPACPVCTFGEKQMHKVSEKALKAEIDLKARNKRSRNRVVDLDGDTVVFDHSKGSGDQGHGPRMASSSSMKSSSGKPFLRRHFSFGSKSARALSDNHPTRKKGFFWAKSSKM